jgi:predicted Fe-Mo cluster-binding NifX family protein
MADLMREKQVDAVLCGNMGPEAKSLLLSYGIIPVVGYCGNADMAADMLITGQLPGMGDDGGCGGNCGGCGGGCHHDDGGDCGCGGGCGCGK